MQRILALLMVLVLLAGVLIACTPEPQLDIPTTNKTQPTTQNTVPGTVPTTVQPTNPTNPTDPTDPTNPTEPTVPDIPPDPPELDFFTRHGQDVPAADQIPDYAQETDTPNLYSLPLDLPTSDMLRTVIAHGDTLYISYWSEFDEMQENSCIRVFDLSTGNTLYEAECPGWSDFGYLDEGGLWFYDYGNQLLYVYDGTGQPTTISLDMSAANPDAFIYNICVDATGEHLLCIYDAEVSVMLYNLKTGAVTTPTFEGGTQIYQVRYRQGKFYLTDYNDLVYELDPATGECIQHSFAIAFDEIRDGIAYEMQSVGLAMVGMDGDPTCYYLKTEYNCWVSDLSHGCVALNSYGEAPRIHVLDLRNELHLADIIFTERCYTTFSQFLDNGSLVILEATNDGNFVYLYDTSATVPDAKMLHTYQGTPQEMEAETAEIAQAVFDATGIEILYGSQGNDFIVSDYVGAVELEPFKVFCAVDTVAELLNRYPEGMLREAWEATNSGMKIFLCGSIYGIWSGSLDQAGGLTTDVDNYIVVAIDINQPMDSVLYHELSHVFDRRIGSMWEQQDWFAVWESVHPFDNAYIYSYDEYYNYMKYTPDGEKKPEKVWFVSSYGRTFPTEDRATILEILCLYTEEPPAELEYEHILYKARLYSYILRQCFPSCNGEEAPFWEQFLGVIDESILPE